MDSMNDTKIAIVKAALEKYGPNERANSYADHIGFLLSVIEYQELSIKELKQKLSKEAKYVDPEFVEKLKALLKEYGFISRPTA